MRLICLLRRREIARAVVLGEMPPTGSPLAVHIARCAACRVYHEELLELTGELPRTLHAPMPTGVFDAAILRRVSPTHSVRIAWRRPLLLATTLGILLLLVLLRGRSHGMRSGYPPVTQSTEQASLRDASSPLRETSSEEKPFPESWLPMPSTTLIPASLRDRTYVTHRIRHRKRRLALHRHSTTPNPVPPAGDVERLCGSRADWIVRGNDLEAEGEHAQATLAYAHAYADQPERDTGFAAGCSAEQAGDLDDALGYYADVLSLPEETSSVP